MDATVIIATRDRRESLQRSLAAVRAQRTDRAFEVLVVDDAGDPPLRPEDVPGARLLRGPGQGPGAARNVALAEARGRVVAFTDDDTEADPGWLEAAIDHLERHPGHPAVHGPIASAPWDPLHDHSIETSAPGSYWTANMAYRREAIERLGGFADDLPTYHGEDVDLGFRALELGPIGWDERMRVLHHPRRETFAQLAGRGRYVENELTVFARHRHRYGRGGRLPAFLFPYANIAVKWSGVLREERERGRLTVPRLARLVAIAVGQALWTTRVLLARAARSASS